MAEYDALRQSGSSGTPLRQVRCCVAGGEPLEALERKLWRANSGVPCHQAGSSGPVRTHPRRLPYAAFALAAVGPGGADFDASRLAGSLASPAALLGFALFVLVFGPVPEEIGWRGYALDALQARRSALMASLWVGAAWALWHLPLFFVPGYFGPDGPPDPVLFTAAILVHSVLYTWIYNHTERAVLAAILFHFSINFTGMLIEGDARVEWTRTALTAVVALGALGVSGAGTLRAPGGHARARRPAS